MKKILGLTIAALLVIGLVGGGTWAYFSDPESTTGNTFTAGTIDLKVNGADWTTAISLTNLKPSDTSVTYTFRNDGTITGDLSFTWGTIGESDHADDTDDTFEYAASGTTPVPDLEMSANEYARLIYVTITNDGGASSVITESSISGNNGDGKISLYELTTYSGTVAVLPAYSTNESITLTFVLADAFDGGSSAPPADWTDYIGGSPAWTILESVGWNVPMADGLNVDITATLTQQS